ncbi:MAG: hypothetical protein GY696_03440 [Gammaproteobacteria bacterium]|nr:hypothetical protein [Gammaproteobacteria bacterium]
MFEADQVLGKPGVLCALRVMQQSLRKILPKESSDPVESACLSLEKDITNFDALARADLNTVECKSEIFPNWFSPPPARAEASVTSAKSEKLDFLHVNHLAWSQILSLLRNGDTDGALKFSEMMRFVAQKGIPFGYDAQVRLLSQIRSEAAEMKVPINDNNLLLSSALVVLSAPKPSEKPSRGGQSRSSSARCVNYNNDKCPLEARECKYLHRCFKCNGSHPVSQCLRASNSAGGPGPSKA